MDENTCRWFGFRDLLWLVVVAIILAAWGWDHVRLASRIEVPDIPARTYPPVQTYSPGVPYWNPAVPTPPPVREAPDGLAPPPGESPPFDRR